MMQAPTLRPTAEDIAHWRTYIGRSEVRQQWLDAPSLTRYAAAVGADLAVEQHLPPLAHWAYFLEAVGSAHLGTDGHPQRGSGLLPWVTLPRRMFAASSIAFLAPLSLSRPAELTLTVADVTHKAGKTGDLILIDVDRVIVQDGSERVRERQTLVYRGIQAPLAPIAAVAYGVAPEPHDWVPSTVDLFRFSAVTFNAHRIHYDLAYTQVEEGYPGLVVQGPLTAAKLYALARETSATHDAPHRFEFRALAPLFAGQPVRLHATDDRGHVQAVRCDGTVAMSARYSGGIR